MVTGKITNIVLAYPSYAVSVNFVDDKDRLPQPQTQTFHIQIQSEEGEKLTKETLLNKIKDYVDQYEQMLDMIDNLQSEVNSEITKDTIIVSDSDEKIS